MLKFVLIAGAVVFISSIRIVKSGQVKLVERLGKYKKTMHSGLNFKIPIIDNISATVTTKEVTFDTPPASVITKDNVSLMIDTVIFYNIEDPVKFKYGIDNARLGIENITATTLRNLIGELELDQTLTSRDTVNNNLRTVLDEATDKWGVKINRVELKNINPPKDILASMEKQMAAERARREQVLNAQGDKESKVLKAEGDKTSAILTATAQKEAAILDAQGQAEAMLKIAEAEAKQIEIIAKAKANAEKMILDVWKECDIDENIIKLRQIEGLEKASEGAANKLIIPTDITSSMGNLESIKHILK